MGTDKKYQTTYSLILSGHCKSEPNNKMQIFVSGAKTDIYDVSPSIKVGDLKDLIEFRSGVACENQVLTFAGRPLQDEQTLSENFRRPPPFTLVKDYLEVKSTVP